MKKAMGLALLLTIGSPQAISNPTLLDKLKPHITEGKINKEASTHYLLLEDSSLLSYAKLYQLDEKTFIEYYLVSSPKTRGNKTIMLIRDYPFWYLYEGISYEDKKMDGINGNEIPQDKQL